jgi:hypothetical protein
MFASDPTINARRHHALVNARVNQDVHFNQRNRPAAKLAEFQQLRSADRTARSLMPASQQRRRVVLRIDP